MEPAMEHHSRCTIAERVMEDERCSKFILWLWMCHDHQSPVWESSMPLFKGHIMLSLQNVVKLNVGTIVSHRPLPRHKGNSFFQVDLGKSGKIGIVGVFVHNDD